MVKLDDIFVGITIVDPPDTGELPDDWQHELPTLTFSYQGVRWTYIQGQLIPNSEDEDDFDIPAKLVEMRESGELDRIVQLERDEMAKFIARTKTNTETDT